MSKIQKCKLNPYNEKTKRVIHLMVTSLCDRNCKYCCNKQYSLDDIPYVTDEELKNCHTLCITGGEPFLFSDPMTIAWWYKKNYDNIEHIYAYGNAKEVHEYLVNHERHSPVNGHCYSGYLDGITVSAKNIEDYNHITEISSWNSAFEMMPSNRIYIMKELWAVMTDTQKGDMKRNCEEHSWELSIRTWQKTFKPDPNSIFRKV